MKEFLLSPFFVSENIDVILPSKVFNEGVEYAVNNVFVVDEIPVFVKLRCCII